MKEEGRGPTDILCFVLCSFLGDHLRTILTMSAANKTNISTTIILLLLMLPLNVKSAFALDYFSKS